MELVTVIRSIKDRIQKDIYYNKFRLCIEDETVYISNNDLDFFFNVIDKYLVDASIYEVALFGYIPERNKELLMIANIFRINVLNEMLELLMKKEIGYKI